MNRCPVCDTPVGDQLIKDYGERIYVNCPTCGQFGITRTALNVLQAAVQKWKGAASLLSHAIRKATNQVQPRFDADTLLFDKELVTRILAQQALPPLREQANNLLQWLGDHLRVDDPAGKIHLTDQQCAAIMGAASGESAIEVVSHLKDRGILNAELYIGGGMDVGLTFPGWDAYDELQRAYSEGSIAFMAMPFGDAQLDSAFRDCFKPAVKQCGFDLRRIDEKPPAGLIDNRLRVEIRRSRFLIVDLTHENRGAYWEAGFAEGLGKPVIYTCEQSYFEKSGTHFDTNHHQTIIWRVLDMASAAQRLKDTIRATLPAEAKLNDE